MALTLSGMTIEVRLEQPEKAPPPMLVTLEGILMEVRLEQPLKALFPMLVTLEGILMEVRLERPLKAYSPMAVTPEGMTVFLQAAISLPVPDSIIALQLLRESYVVFPLTTVIEVNEEQP